MGNPMQRSRSEERETLRGGPIIPTDYPLICGTREEEPEKIVPWICVKRRRGFAVSQQHSPFRFNNNWTWTSSPQAVTDPMDEGFKAFVELNSPQYSSFSKENSSLYMFPTPF